MTAVLDQFIRPASASTVATSWSHHTAVSVGHNVPHRHIPVVKGDVNFVTTNHMMDSNEEDAVPSPYIKEILERLAECPIDSIDHEDALEFVYDLFYMHSPYNQDDSRIARLLIESDYCSIAHQCLVEFMNCGIFSHASIRRSTQFILYTLWNFTGISIEFRLHLSNNPKLIQFLLNNFLAHVKTLKVEPNPTEVVENIMQATVSILHNLTLNVNLLNNKQAFEIFDEILREQEPSKTNERFRITLLLCLINLNAKRVNQQLDVYQPTLKLLFHFLKKIVQQEILMISTGLSAWVLAYAINKLPVDVVLADENRLYSFMILFKRGVREEKLQASFTLNRCLEKSSDVKELMVKDVSCWNQYEQFKVFHESDSNHH